MEAFGCSRLGLAKRPDAMEVSDDLSVRADPKVKLTF